jgi:hypothetical protein
MTGLEVSINEISFGKVTFQCIIDILDTCQGKGLAEEGDISCFQAPLGTFQKPGEDNGGQFHSILPMPD